MVNNRRMEIENDVSRGVGWRREEDGEGGKEEGREAEREGENMI